MKFRLLHQTRIENLQKILQFCKNILLSPTEADDKASSLFSIIVASEFQVYFKKKVCLFYLK